MKTKENNRVFSNFIDYWHYARHLMDFQKDMLFNTLSPDEREYIEKSYKEGGWDDVFQRNMVNKTLERIEKKHKINLVEIKQKVVRGKSVYLSRRVWDEIRKELSPFDKKHVHFCYYGIKATVCKENSKVILLTSR